MNTLNNKQKEGLGEMSKHEPNCHKSGDIMEECTCPTLNNTSEGLGYNARNPFKFPPKNQRIGADTSEGKEHKPDYLYELEDRFGASPEILTFVYEAVKEQCRQAADTKLQKVIDQLENKKLLEVAVNPESLMWKKRINKYFSETQELLKEQLSGNETKFPDMSSVLDKIKENTDILDLSGNETKV